MPKLQHHVLSLCAQAFRLDSETRSEAAATPRPGAAQAQSTAPQVCSRMRSCVLSCAHTLAAAIASAQAAQ